MRTPLPVVLVVRCCGLERFRHNEDGLIPEIWWRIPGLKEPHPPQLVPASKPQYFFYS